MLKGVGVVAEKSSPNGMYRLCPMMLRSAWPSCIKHYAPEAMASLISAARANNALRVCKAFC
ncbi:hypothetical protein OR573_07150 [Halomonas sp. CH40]